MGPGAPLHSIPENCTGCMLCRLACSLIKTKTFSYARALIDVPRVGTVERYHPVFKPECDACGFCVHYCAFDALRKQGTEDHSQVRPPANSLSS